MTEINELISIDFSIFNYSDSLPEEHINLEINKWNQKNSNNESPCLLLKNISSHTPDFASKIAKVFELFKKKGLNIHSLDLSWGYSPPYSCFETLPDSIDTLYINSYVHGASQTIYNRHHEPVGKRYVRHINVNLYKEIYKAQHLTTIIFKGENIANAMWIMNEMAYKLPVTISKVGFEYNPIRKEYISLTSYLMNFKSDSENDYTRVMSQHGNNKYIAFRALLKKNLSNPNSPIIFQPFRNHVKKVAALLSDKNMNDEITLIHALEKINPTHFNDSLANLVLLFKRECFNDLMNELQEKKSISSLP